MSKRQFIQKAMKTWGSAHDENPKTRIQTLLREIGINDILFDETIFVNKQTFDWSTTQPEGTKDEIWNKYHVFRPDIISKTKKLIIELDGSFHFNTKKGVRQTNSRNEIYEYMDVNFVWFATDGNKIDKTDEEIIDAVTKGFPV